MTKAKKFFIVFSCLLIFTTFLIVPSSAQEYTIYNPIAPIWMNDFSGEYSLIAFPGAHSSAIYLDGQLMNYDYLSNVDYSLYPDRILFDGSFNAYITLFLQCHYSSVYVDDVVYDSGNDIYNGYNLHNSYSFICSPVEHSYNGSVYYTYYFNVYLGSMLSYDEIYTQGYLDGLDNTDNNNEHYNAGYNDGYDHGITVNESAALGKNLLGDTFSAPFEALNSFVLYESTGGFQVTLGGLLGAIIGLGLFMAFLKLFAGG